MCLKVEKRLLFVIKYLVLKQTPLILWNAPKMGYKYIFACKQIYSTFNDMLNVEQYLSRSRWKRHVYIVYFSCAKGTPNFKANAALSAQTI